MIFKKAVIGLFLLALVFPLEAGDTFGKNPIVRDCCDLGPPPLSNRLGLAVRGGDSDFGQQVILTEREHYKPLSLSARGSYQWTNNAALTERDRLHDSYFQGAADLLYRPVISKNLFADVELSYYRYRYDKNRSLDIDEQNARLGMIHLSPKLANTSFFAHYTYDRLLDGRHHDEIYTSHGLQAGLYKGFALSARQSISVRAFSKFSLKDTPEYAERNEYNAVVAYQIVPTDAIDAELFYRARLYDFQNGREDISQLVGLSITYWFSDIVAITGSISATFNNSNEQGGDYEEIEGGASLAVNFTF